MDMAVRDCDVGDIHFSSHDLNKSIPVTCTNKVTFLAPKWLIVRIMNIHIFISGDRVQYTDSAFHFGPFKLTVTIEGKY